MSKKTFRIRLLEIIGPRVQRLRLLMLRIKGYKNIHPSVIIERGCNLDRTFPEEIYIDEGCLIASRVTILCHEHIYRDPEDARLPLKLTTKIGKNTFVGVGALIMPGVTVGDQSIIASGAVVTKDVPPNSLVSGVPAKVKKSGIQMKFGAIAIIEGKENN